MYIQVYIHSKRAVGREGMCTHVHVHVLMRDEKECTGCTLYVHFLVNIIINLDDVTQALIT